jgi:hypothetical protein
MPDRGIVASIVAITITLFFCGLVLLMAFHPVPSVNQRFIDGAVGGLIVQFANVVGFYFGSSREAQAKAVQREPVHVPAPSTDAKKS